jgi:hypothetical protein
MLYQEGDEIRLVETGELLTVHADLSGHLEPGIIVKEKIGRLVRRSEVRPAGRTRQILEAELGVAASENHVLSTDSLYAEHDKIILHETGEILTVHADMSRHLEPGIIVKEKIGRLVGRQEVESAPAASPELQTDADTAIAEKIIENMDRLYAEHDKIMLLETGEVLTVHADLSNDPDGRIVVKEQIRRPIQRSQVRPAGHTRQRLEAEVGITQPELPPPSPVNYLNTEAIADTAENSEPSSQSYPD